VLAPLALDDRRVPEPLRHALRRDRGRHDDDLEVRPRLALHLARQRQREVGVQVALVELVEDQDPDALEEGVVLQHAHEQPLGDDQDARARTRLALEAHLEADLAPDSPPALLRHAPRRRPRRDAPRLEHDDLQRAREPGLEQRRRHARGLPGAGRRAQHRAGRCPQGRDQRRQDGVDRERLGHAGDQSIRPVPGSTHAEAVGFRGANSREERSTAPVHGALRGPGPTLSAAPPAGS
jgi:hypothetical protein